MDYVSYRGSSKSRSDVILALEVHLVVHIQWYD